MSRNERLKNDAERFERYGAPGNISKLVDDIKDACDKMDYVQIVKELPSWVSLLTEKQKCVVQLHYFKQVPIAEIRFQIGANSNRDVERCLTGAKKKLLQIAKDFNTIDKRIRRA